MLLREGDFKINKGQVTIFIIIALLIVGAAAAYFLIKGNVLTSK